MRKSTLKRSGSIFRRSKKGGQNGGTYICITQHRGSTLLGLHIMHMISWYLNLQAFIGFDQLIMLMLIMLHKMVLADPTDIRKSTGPQSLTGENSRGLMKTFIVLVLLSIKKNPVGSPSMGILMLKKIRSCKNFGGPIKLGFSMWLRVLRSC